MKIGLEVSEICFLEATVQKEEDDGRRGKKVTEA